jgi:mRNA interferase HigB
MRILSKRTLKVFWLRQPRAQGPLETWFRIATEASWSSPSDIKSAFGTSVDFLADNRVVFDIGGNRYRLVLHISYEFQRILVKFVGTHKEYDKIDARTI